jgi:hypothetical protein
LLLPSYRFIVVETILLERKVTSFPATKVFAPFSQIALLVALILKITAPRAVTEGWVRRIVLKARSCFSLAKIYFTISSFERSTTFVLRNSHRSAMLSIGKEITWCKYFSRAAYSIMQKETLRESKPK